MLKIRCGTGLEDRGAREGGQRLVRSQRGLSPPERAKRLQPYADTMVATPAAFLRIPSANPAVIEGTVRITTAEVIAIQRLASILADLRRAPCGRGGPRALRASRLSGRQITAELGGHDLIGMDDAPASRKIFRAFPDLARHGFALRTNTTLAQVAAIRAGFGIGVCQVAPPRATRRSSVCCSTPSPAICRYGWRRTRICARMTIAEPSSSRWAPDWRDPLRRTLQHAPPREWGCLVP